MFTLCAVTWFGCVLVSWIFLVFYRSPFGGHGPDTVGDEVSHFLWPLVISLPFGIALIWLTPTFGPQIFHTFCRWTPLATFLMGCIEGWLYPRLRWPVRRG